MGRPGTARKCTARKCKACGGRGHYASEGACSQTHRAALLVIDGGYTQKAAAREFGIRQNTVSEAVIRLRAIREVARG